MKEIVTLAKSAYRVQYWKGENTHNRFYYDDYRCAEHQYMHWLLNQMMETRGIVDLVRFEQLGSDGEYHRIFESRTFHCAETL